MAESSITIGVRVSYPYLHRSLRNTSNIKIPVGVFPTSLETLDLGFNQLRDISDSVLPDNIQTLFLDSNPFRRIPPVVYNLSDLAYVHLEAIQLTQVSPKDFLNPQNLRGLYLSGNSITVLSPAIFQNFTGLKELDLSQNQISQLPVSIFDSLTGLQFLDLSFNRITKVPSLDALRFLQSLNLAKNGISQLPSFEFLAELQFLDVNSNFLSKAPELQSCTRLQTVTLDNNRLTEIPRLGGKPRLTRLSLSGNKITTAAMWSQNHLPKLEELLLSFNVISEITGTWFLSTHLNVIDLRENPVKVLNRSMFPPDAKVQVAGKYLHCDINSERALCDCGPGRDKAGDDTIITCECTRSFPYRCGVLVLWEVALLVAALTVVLFVCLLAIVLLSRWLRQVIAKLWLKEGTGFQLDPPEKDQLALNTNNIVRSARVCGQRAAAKARRSALTQTSHSLSSQNEASYLLPLNTSQEQACVKFLPGRFSWNVLCQGREFLAIACHNNLLRFLGTDSRFQWVFTEFCQHGSLYSLLFQAQAERGLYPTPDLTLCLRLRLAHQTLSGLFFLHDQDLVHGFLNSSNVLVHESNELTAKITNYHPFLRRNSGETQGSKKNPNDLLAFALILYELVKNAKAEDVYDFKHGRIIPAKVHQFQQDLAVEQERAEESDGRRQKFQLSHGDSRQPTQQNTAQITKPSQGLEQQWRLERAKLGFWFQELVEFVAQALLDPKTTLARNSSSSRDVQNAPIRKLQRFEEDARRNGCTSRMDELWLMRPLRNKNFTSCPTFRHYWKVLKYLKIDPRVLDARFHRCYCPSCYKGPTHKKQGQPARTFSIPVGGARFGLQCVQHQKHDPTVMWQVSYHGASSEAVRTILEHDFSLVIPGQITMTGGQISVCKDHDPSKGSDQLFLSPSFRYANFVKELAKDREGKKQVLAPYAKPFAFEGKYYLVSLQILVRPGTFDIIPHSLGKFEFPRNYDPPLSNNELEYCTRTQNGHSLQGVCITSLETLFQQNKRKG
eukprot:m.175605 g.175605  ORF g.175605 m.175605 type:complete len:1009 (-) comp25298_c0_seq45:46-3072(-)